MSAGENLVKLAKKLYKEVLAEFYFPSIPEPIIVHNGKGESIISVDKENWVLKLNVSRIPRRLIDGALPRFLKMIWRRGIAYYLVCPYDAANATKILTIAISETDEKTGVFLANLFVELVITAYLHKRYPDETIWFIEKSYESIDWKRVVKNKKVMVFTLLLEKITEQEIVPSKYKEKIDKFFVKACEKAYEALESAGFFLKEKWPEAVRNFSRALKKVLSESKKPVFSRIIIGREKVVENILYRNPYVPDIFQLMRYHGREVSSDLLELITAALEATGKDIIKATPAMKVIGIKNPSPLLKQWYRLRAKDFLKQPPKKRVSREGEAVRIPKIWQVTDPPEKLDIYLSLSSFPLLIPNLTTRKWDHYGLRSVDEKGGVPKHNILIIIDSSGSMGYFPGWRLERIDEQTKRMMKRLGMKYPPNSKFDLAVLTAYILLSYAKESKARVAVLNFSGKAIISRWGSKHEEIENTIGIYQANGTEFPCKALTRLIKEAVGKVLVFFITDSEIYNQEKTKNCLLQLLEEGHELYILHAETLYNMLAIQLEEKGARLFKIRNENDIKKLSEFLARRLLG